MERRQIERRINRDRRTPGAPNDSARPEQEHFFRQVDELIRMVHRIEHQLNTVMKRLDQLENSLLAKRK